MSNFFSKSTVNPYRKKSGKILNFFEKWKIRIIFEIIFSPFHIIFEPKIHCGALKEVILRLKFFFSYSDIFTHLHPHLKKKIAKNAKNYKNFRKKMKFKMRLVAGNGIRPEKIRPEGPLNPQESSCKILWSHLKNSRKKSPKTYPPQKKPPFWGGVGCEMNKTRQHRRGVCAERASKILPLLVSHSHILLYR